MDYVENNLEAVNDWLENLDNSGLLNIHREYCEQSNHLDDEVYYNDEEFFEMFYPNTIDALRAAEYGDYRFQHEFVKINGLGNLDSADNIKELIDLYELAQYIFDNTSEFSDYVELEEEEDIEEVEEALIDSWNDYINEVQEDEDEDVTAVYIEDVDLYLEGFRERHLEIIVDYEKLLEDEDDI